MWISFPGVSHMILYSAFLSHFVVQSSFDPQVYGSPLFKVIVK
jgi:hypothetical protein